MGTQVFFFFFFGVVSSTLFFFLGVVSNSPPDDERPITRLNALRARVNRPSELGCVDGDFEVASSIFVCMSCNVCRTMYVMQCMSCDACHAVYVVRCMSFDIHTQATNLLTLLAKKGTNQRFPVRNVEGSRQSCVGTAASATQRTSHCRHQALFHLGDRQAHGNNEDEVPGYPLRR